MKICNVNENIKTIMYTQKVYYMDLRLVMGWISNMLLLLHLCTRNPLFFSKFCIDIHTLMLAFV
jgi:hypothetical protein